MSLVGYFGLSDFWEDGSLRSYDENRIGCILDEESPSNITRHHSQLWEPGPDDSGSSAFGDNAVHHLKIDEECSPIFYSGTRQIMSSFSGWWHNNNGYQGFWAWMSSADNFAYISCSFLPETTGTNFACEGYVIGRFRDSWQYSWGWPLCYSMGFGCNKWTEEECKAYAIHCWDSLCGLMYPWGEPMSLNLQFGYQVSNLDRIEYPSSPVRDIGKFFEKYFPDRTDVNAAKTRLLNDCISKLEVSDNNIANLREFISIINDARNGRISNLYRDFQQLVKPSKTSGLEKVGKFASNNWLRYRYAYKTTVSDLNQFIGAAEKDYLRKITDQTLAHPLRAGGTFDGEEWHLKCRLHESNRDPFMAMAERVRRYGLLPDLHTLWDMIPFSFAVDWFLPVDDFLSSVDHHWYSQGYEFDELLYSRKRQKDLEIAGIQLHLTDYSRWLDSEVAPWSYTREDSGGCTQVAFNRTADGLSLIVGMMP